jgi:hypothetical protein
MGGSLVMKVQVPQNWNFFSKRVGAVLLKGGGPCNSKREFPVVTLRPTFKIRNPFYLTSRVTQNNDWIFENIRVIVKFVFIFFSFQSVYCGLALHT